MNAFDNLYSMIAKIVLDVTRFNVPRIGIVSQNNDPLSKGRVLAHIPSFNWVTDDTGAWCYPKDKGALITPATGDYILVEFIDGDRDLPVYSGIATQMKDMLPSAYDGKATTQVIFEDKNGDMNIKYDEISKELSFNNAASIKLLSGTEAFLKGNTFDAWITATLLTIFNDHVHPETGTTTLSPVTPLTGPTNHLSTTIKGE